MTFTEGELIRAIRTKQVNHSVIGAFFEAMYEYLHRLGELMPVQLPLAILSVDADPRGWRGWYIQEDGLLLPNRININVHVLENGEDAAEVMTHEAVHMWQTHYRAWSPQSVANIEHDDTWRSLMLTLGIETAPNGTTTCKTNHWYEWIRTTNADLHLRNIILPGNTQHMEFKER